MTEAAGIFTREKTRLAGCYVLRTKVREDMRGSFTKVYHEGAFRELGLTTEFRGILLRFQAECAARSPLPIAARRPREARLVHERQGA